MIGRNFFLRALVFALGPLISLNTIFRVSTTAAGRMLELRPKEVRLGLRGSLCVCVFCEPLIECSMNLFA